MSRNDFENLIMLLVVLFFILNVIWPGGYKHVVNVKWSQFSNFFPFVS